MVRIIVGIIIGILLVIFMIQNTANVEITLFAWTITVSRAILVLLILIFGIFLGVVFTEIAFIRRNMKIRKKEKEKQEKEKEKEQKKDNKKEKQMKEKEQETEK